MGAVYRELDERLNSGASLNREPNEMSPLVPSPLIDDACDEVRLEVVKQLFRSYADEFADTVAEALCLQGFTAEIDGLPGRYAPPLGCLLLAMAGDTPAGCVALRGLGSGMCEMKRLYVVPSERHKGTGRRLVAEIIRRAEMIGYQRIVLHSMPEMTRALALYRECGFEDTEPDWEHTGNHAIFMEKRIVSPEVRPATRRKEQTYTGPGQVNSDPL